MFPAWAGEFYCPWDKLSNRINSILSSEDFENFNIFKMLNSSSSDKGQTIPNDAAQVQSSETSVCERLTLSSQEGLEDFHFYTFSSGHRIPHNVFAACANLEMSNNRPVEFQELNPELPMWVTETASISYWM